ncbi:exodeoxyribonuclease VII large subunit [Mucilaginibacter sp. CAU 1740]|uniref:exodeoxyribonuclease VII large subunit n=1 Tax=Mucilaginibacter sp. CAU 1740 TaxID=3140365 RepID=UPI00325AE127
MQPDDTIVVSRGGEENLTIFNKPVIAEAAINLSALFVTAIGHKEDATLLQKVADKAFIMSTAFGQFLNESYNETVAELQHSRAQLVESVKKQLTAAYQKEIDNEKQSKADLQKVYEERISGMISVQQEKQQVYEQRMLVLEKKGKLNWIVVLIAVI